VAGSQVVGVAGNTGGWASSVWHVRNRDTNLLSRFFPKNVKVLMPRLIKKPYICKCLIYEILIFRYLIYKILIFRYLIYKVLIFKIL